MPVRIFPGASRPTPEDVWVRAGGRAGDAAGRWRWPAPRRSLSRALNSQLLVIRLPPEALNALNLSRQLRECRVLCVCDQ